MKLTNKSTKISPPATNFEFGNSFATPNWRTNIVKMARITTQNKADDVWHDCVKLVQKLLTKAGKRQSIPANDWHELEIPGDGNDVITLPRIQDQSAIFDAVFKSELWLIVGGGGQAQPPPLVWNNGTPAFVSLRSRPDIVAVMLMPTHCPLVTGIR
jgi:hypothetical protein